jgi:hypothetical protein
MKLLFNMRYARPRGGYILMEVMLATGIFAMAGVSLAIVLSQAISAGGRVQRESDITWALESKLAQARLDRLTPGVQTLQGDGDGVVYTREVGVLDMKNMKNNSMNGLYGLKITAKWKEERRNVEMVAQTYVYQK